MLVRRPRPTCEARGRRCFFLSFILAGTGEALAGAGEKTHGLLDGEAFAERFASLAKECVAHTACCKAPI